MKQSFLKAGLAASLMLFITLGTSCNGGLGATVAGAGKVLDTVVPGNPISGVISIAANIIDKVESLAGLPQKDGQINFDGLDFSLKDKNGNQIGTPIKIAENKISVPPVPEDKAEDVQFAINDGDKEVLSGNLDGQALSPGESFTITEENITTNNITDSNVIENSNNTTGGNATNVIIENGTTGNVQIGNNTTVNESESSTPEPAEEPASDEGEDAAGA